MLYAFYNSNCSILNGSASPFRYSYWRFTPLHSTSSLLQEWLLSKAIDTLTGNALPKVHWNLHPFRSLAMIRPQLTFLLLSLLLLSIQKSIYKKYSGRFLKPKLPPLAPPIKSHWKPNHLTSIVVSPIWNAITSASSLSQQFEDYFTTAKIKGSNHIFFAASFLYDCINFCWQQYKRKHEAKSLVPIT